MVNGNKVIAICVGKDSNEEVFAYIERIHERAKEQGYITVVYNFMAEIVASGSREKVDLDRIDLINFDFVDGVIIIRNHQIDDVVINKIIKKASENNKPRVVIGESYEDAFCVRFQGDDCFESLVRHVVEEHNCKNVYFMAGQKGVSYCEHWVSLYKKVLEENGIPFDASKVGYGEYWNYPTYKVMDEWLKNPIIPEAIVCANDSMAIAVCEKLNEAGYSVPENVIVTGFDGIMMAKYHHPRITTSEVDLDTVCDIVFEVIDTGFDTGDFSPMVIQQQYVRTLSQSCGCEKNEVKNAGKLINSLYERVSYDEANETQMFRFAGRMAASQSLEDIINVFKRYLVGNCYLSLKTDILGETDELSEVAKDRVELDESMDIVSSARGLQNDRMKVFPQGIYLPDLEILSDVKHLYCVYPLVYNQEVFGYFVSITSSDIRYVTGNNRMVNMSDILINMIKNRK